MLAGFSARKIKGSIFAEITALLALGLRQVMFILLTNTYSACMLCDVLALLEPMLAALQVGEHAVLSRHAARRKQCIPLAS